MKLRHFLGLALTACLTHALTGCATIADGGSPALASIGPVMPGAAAYVVADANDGKVLLSYMPDQKRSVASLTKIATAAVVLDFLRSSGGNADEMMVVPGSVTGLGVPSPLGLQPGDGISVRDALYAAMMASDNFAAETLGAHFGARLSSAGMGSSPLGAFVNQMNGLASRLDLRNTRFANPSGLDLPNASGYSCASDIARLFSHAITIPGFTFYSSLPERRITHMRGGQRTSIVVRNTNELIGAGRIDAGKTGTTSLAGPCLVVTEPKPATVIKRNDGSTVVIPHRLIVVTLGAPDRFGMTKRLLQEGWRQYDGWRAAGSPANTASEFLSGGPNSARNAAPAPPSAPPPPPAAPPSGGLGPMPPPGGY